MRKLFFHLRRLRHLILVNLFSELRDRDLLHRKVAFLEAQERRLAIEVAKANDLRKLAQQELRDQKLATSHAMDRASQLVIANEQLQVQLTATTRELADRVERAYGGMANWMAMGGIASRRQPFAWVPLAEPPVPPKMNLDGSFGRIQARDAERQMNEQVTAEALKTGEQLHKQMEQDMAKIKERFNAGTVYMDSAGQFKDVATEELVTE
jgi:hypothetical protein